MAPTSLQVPQTVKVLKVQNVFDGFPAVSVQCSQP